MKPRIIILSMLLILVHAVFPQDLSKYLDDSSEDEDTIVQVKSTFRTPRVVNLHSIEIPEEGELIFNVGHRFGEVRDGYYNFFGLDQATIRLGFDYGISPNFAAGIGRSSFQKSYDTWLKTKILTQNNSTIPMSIAIYFSGSYNSLKNVFPDEYESFKDRLSAGGSLILARKFTDVFSFQVTPLWMKSNYLPEIGKGTDDLSLGMGSRIKITPMLHTNIEYIFKLKNNEISNQDVLSLGFDLETGGHVFQLFLSNTRGITEKPVLFNTTGAWAEGAIYFGFNITRTFYLN